MATSSRHSSLFGINDWKTIYQTFKEADFRSYDYETLRKSFIDYLRVNYPETFNDYIESSEFIALLDVIAFMGQGLAFRSDLNTRENFIDTAERRDSVVKLANLVSYSPKRNLAGQGYLKVTSIQTTQNITDLTGINLSNVPILWDDPANSAWVEQFNTVINAALVSNQRFGRPGNSSTILGVKTDEYSLSLPSSTLPVVPFTSTVDGTSMNFELVSATSADESFVYELPPTPTGKFNLLYRNDKLGYGSPNTGFFFYFKQGSLQSFDFTLNQQVSNRVIDIDVQGVNDSDTWLYQLDGTNAPVQWSQVSNIYADTSNSAQSTTSGNNRTIYSVASRFSDQVSYVFGDNVFGKLPIGQFRAYVRSSNALTYTIDPLEMQNISVSFKYLSRVGRQETLTVSLQLQTPVSNAQARETLANIKQRAPARYYTQNRMVNGEDYTNFPYTLYSSIIKSKAVNRSSVGVSRNLDLLDPTGKYSSTNSFASDGALYLSNADGSLSLQINSTGDIFSFLSNDLVVALGSNRAVQYYNQTFTRYPISVASSDGVVHWHSSTVDSNSMTGYFFTNVGSVALPQPVGTYSTKNAKYVTKGARLKFEAPAGYYFNEAQRLVAGIATQSGSTFIWSTVQAVVGDGYNNGEGQFSNGSGPVTLSGYVPSQAILTTVIPAFDNTLPTTVIQEAATRMELQQNFSLIFDNSLTITQNRWSVGSSTDSTAFVLFTAQGSNRYAVTYKSLSYFFSSVADTRFTFDADKVVYDPVTGKVLKDFINVLSTNTQPGSNYPLSAPVKVSIVGQPVQADGFADDYQVEVSSADSSDSSIISNPDFFSTVTGYTTGSTNVGVYVFFEQVQDAINLTRYQIIPSTKVAYQYATKTLIETSKYEYPVGQLFYAYADNKFYTTVLDQTVTTLHYVLQEQTQYKMQPGRQGLQFQYRHNSNNTSRIDPATTNIVDLYVVTQAYYTAFRNWIQDTTGTVSKPNTPTINELNQAYGKLQDYKMLSDSIVLNSVTFKPLFGKKAAPALQASVKVIRSAATKISDSEIRTAVLSAMNQYFDVNNWNFGDTFYFSELSAFIHSTVGEMVSSVVIVPNDSTQSFGNLYQIGCAPNEIFMNGATASDIVVISSLTPSELQNSVS